jgi:LysM repeat protein
MQRKLRDPRLIGFILGFGGVALIGMLLVVSWAVLRADPSPTLAPTAVPASERANELFPTSATDVATALPRTPSPQAGEPTATPTPTRSDPVQHTVREGDTLFEIALAYGVSVETIRAANNLEGETIVIGQVLTVPPGPLPTPTPYVEAGALIHTVSSGETLIAIAENYSVTVESIQTANDLSSEIIQPGQKLRVLVKDVELPAAISPRSTATLSDTGWKPSILTGNLVAAYPLTYTGELFTMHYQPDTPAARDPDHVAGLVQTALDHIEETVQVTLEDPFDVYVAGSLFAPDDTALRGRSFSEERRNFYLYDDTGTPEERAYMMTHELTHLVAWNTIGKPESVMLHEGLAVYTGIPAMEAAGFIPLEHFCAAYREADQLPRLTENRSYLGHIRDLDLYFAAGCFATHLIDEYGMADFKRVFTSADYPGTYGRTLAQLEREWLQTLGAVAGDLAFDPEDLVTSVDAVADAYDLLFTDFGGTKAQMDAYRALDEARIAMLQGQFEDTQAHLAEFKTLLDSN